MTRIHDVETLKSMFDYYPETGALIWKFRPEMADRWNTRYAGKPALCVPTRGYLHGTIQGNRFFAHRVIWKLIHGSEPETIDHINGDRGDNRLENLRAVSKADNLRNKRMSPYNSSGFNGVCFHKPTGRWLAYTQRNGKRTYLGLHATAEEAGAARMATDSAFGFHRNHGRI